MNFAKWCPCTPGLQLKKINGARCIVSLNVIGQIETIQPKKHVINPKKKLEITEQIECSKNGKCLSTEYKNCETKSYVKVRELYATFNSVKNNKTSNPNPHPNKIKVFLNFLAFRTQFIFGRGAVCT